ncbi:MAG TPA: hypothetical protein VGO61_13490 [Steroidobacteraceae bacterium]|nr:hypothetical protein [Steroidobacteraceae bacterium]
MRSKLPWSIAAAGVTASAVAILFMRDEVHTADVARLAEVPRAASTTPPRRATRPAVAPTPATRRPAATPAATPAAAALVEDLELEISATDPGARDLVLQKRLPKLVAQDPERAARFAELQTDPALRELTIRQVALLWGASDAERAANWARSLPDATERDATIIDIANGLSSVDPARGVQLREQFVGAAKADSALSNLVQQWAGFDFDAALAWTEARAPGGQRDELMQRLIYVRAASGDPAAAARLVDRSSLAGEAKAAAVASVTQEWTGRDAAAAGEWLQTH